MSKLLHYLIWMTVYLGFCFLCDIVFEDDFTFKETLIHAFTFIIAINFIRISEKKGWNSWNWLIGFFKRKK